jgi:hypothetical protein
MAMDIEIRYWHSKLPNTPWEGEEVFKFKTKKDSRRKLWKILARIEDAGYNAMILHHDHIFTTTVFICDGRFRTM